MKLHFLACLLNESDDCRQGFKSEARGKKRLYEENAFETMAIKDIQGLG